MGNIPKVAVIMSTYNGEKYLKEQIDSILNQEQVKVYLYIFDDCSKDSTVEIAKEYQQKHNNVYFHINEKNKNFTYNFIDGLFAFKDNQEYDYYAFSDQDDVWLPNKLITAIEKIKEVGKCTLYSSNLQLVDGELKSLKKTMLDILGNRGRYQYKKHDELYENIVTGCTMVFDNQFKDAFTKKYPDNIYLHDYWMGLFANYAKGVNYIYDDCSNYILYRQHGKNLLGAKRASKFKKICIFLLKKDYFILEYVKKFYEFYEDNLKYRDKLLIEKYINYRQKGNRKFILDNLDTNYLNKFKRKLIFNKLGIRKK